ncbi:MAG: SDR family oxidoreductase [Chloroflexi bacterium]|nr:SDR family oxidoreductase [Chloroflexota bacterium]
MRFSDKVAIVTGEARGIGKAIAVRLAKEGAKVMVVDKNPDTPKDTVEGIKKDGAQATAIAADMTKAEDVHRMVQATMEQFGKIDILVNNVGLFTFEPFLDTKEEWDRLLTLNLKSTLLCSQAVLKEMVKKSYGKIVNISSDAARIGVTTMGSYSAAKAGVMGLTKTLAREMARYNININCVCPGLVDTQMTADLVAFAPEMKEKMIKAVPFRRLATPEDAAAAVCFFASDEASYITGQSLSVNGGQAMF